MPAAFGVIAAWAAGKAGLLELDYEEHTAHRNAHAAVSLMIAGGADVATVAGILGHSQTSTTLDIYTHAFDKNKKAASAELQGMLEI